ncbi:MAG TPA: phosphoribosyltransferase family protein [Nitrososphaeraceae archaeon]|nr:phosphoribosyltransferase family protein [Nitrososphaeraceae archaeon]
MKLNRYPDGTSYINDTKLGEQVFRLNTYEDLWHLNQFVDAFHSEHDTLTVKMKPNIIIPNLIDAQADRRFNKGESSGLRLVLEFLNRLEANFKIFHPHNGEIVEAMTNNVEIIDNTEFIKEVLQNLQLMQKNNSEVGLDYVRPLSNLVLFSSDAGGFKPLMKLADKLKWRGEVYGASKSRKYEEGKSKLVQVIDRQDFEGKDVLIIDDISVYGGTFVGLAKMLRQRNVGRLYLAVSHLTVPNPNPELFTLFDKLFTTNSKYDEYFPIPHKDGGGASKADNLEIIKLF